MNILSRKEGGKKHIFLAEAVGRSQAFAEVWFRERGRTLFNFECCGTAEAKNSSY